MTNWSFRTMIVPASLAPTCRALASSFPGGSGMWTQGLSPTGNAPITHYISTGKIFEQFAGLLSSSQALATGTGISIEQASMLLSAADISNDPPYLAMARLGLQPVNGASV